MKSFVSILLLSIVLTACQNTDQIQATKHNVNYELLLDEYFPSYQQTFIESSDDIFALSKPMKIMVANKLLPITNKQKRAKQLIEEIFNRHNLEFVYSSTANLKAREAYEQSTANCLSLTIMAYALAKEAKLNIHFQEVEIPEYWERNGRYNMLTGHVNLRLPAETQPGMVIIYGKHDLQIDFDPYIARKHFKGKLINKAKVLAMFYNNKAAQAIVDEEYSKAYAYLRAAIISFPTYSNAWGNLGLLYRLTDHFYSAEQAYLYALTLNKNNLTTLSNYAVLLTMNGKSKLAAKINQQLTVKRRENPYYQALLADEALYRGDLNEAVIRYKKAIRLNNKIHEFYFGLAKVYYQKKQLNKAQLAMKKAIALNTLADVEKHYLAKLNFLQHFSQ